MPAAPGPAEAPGRVLLGQCLFWPRGSIGVGGPRPARAPRPAPVDSRSTACSPDAGPPAPRVSRVWSGCGEAARRVSPEAPGSRGRAGWLPCRLCCGRRVGAGGRARCLLHACSLLQRRWASGVICARGYLGPPSLLDTRGCWEPRKHAEVHTACPAGSHEAFVCVLGCTDLEGPSPRCGRQPR